jgi:superfamily II DNA or RNA helicase
MSNYPDSSDDDFNKKITSKYKKYTIPDKKQTFKQICYPEKYELQIPQKFLGEYINPKTPYKSILVFHRIGAGKTCSAINIAEQWKHKRKIIVVVPASLIGNFKAELRSPCAGDSYLTSKERIKLSKLHPSSKEYKEIIALSDDRIKKHYTIYSYNKFIKNAADLSLTNTLLIIDEIQNMVSLKGIYYKTLYETIQRAPSNLRLVLLSATPILINRVK